jgi:hypothetical protein
VDQSQTFSTTNRLGLHYFPDTLHYRMRDLEVWLPQLSQMGIGWLTLLAPSGRAIPEYFLEGLLASHIQPVLQFQIPPQSPYSIDEYRLLFSNYARWGVQYVALFDRPNNRSNWSTAAWAQADLVERFLDQYLPLADTALDEGMIPIFPPLEPGGDYWDLSFLQSALQGMQRRGKQSLLDRLALGAYAWVGDRSLEWGAGGAERWSTVAPYSTPSDSEDQCGFRIFEWYSEISQRELGKHLPLFLLRIGSLPGDQIDPTRAEPDYLVHAERNLTIARLLANEPVEGFSPIAEEVKAGNFWLLSAQESSVYAPQGWFRSEDEKLPVVNSFYRFSARKGIETPTEELSFDPAQSGADGTESLSPTQPDEQPDCTPDASSSIPSDASDGVQLEQEAPQQDQPNTQSPAQADDPSRSIAHYVLLPLYAWGAADWDLELLQPLLQDAHPTVGFSLTEASMAARVTVVGGSGAISAEALEMLRSNGCKVERIQDNGTLVAS